MRISCVSGGDHGDIAFHFGAIIIVETTNGKIDLDVSVLEVLCQTDSAELLEKTILKRLTKGMRTVATDMLYIYIDAQ